METEIIRDYLKKIFYIGAELESFNDSKGEYLEQRETALHTELYNTVSTLALLLSVKLVRDAKNDSRPRMVEHIAHYPLQCLCNLFTKDETTD